MSRKQRICVGIELTVPMEHNIAKWHQSKLLKYENELRIEAERNNWTFHSCVIEVGARGWIPPSLVSSLNKLGLPSVKNLSNDLSLLAMKSSYLIWLNRFNREFVLGDSVFNGQVRYVQHLVLLLVFLALQLVRMVLRVLSRLLPVAQSQSRSKWMRLHITA
jgi:hypothetical protein